jgi:lipopolysaccharide transport system ATP-binding protein
VDVEAIELLDVTGGAVDQIGSGDPLRVRIKLRFEHPVAKPEINVGTHTTDFIYLTTSSTALFDDRPDFGPGLHSIECHIPSYPLKPGVYCVRLAIFDQHRRLVYSGETLKIFSVRANADEGRQSPMRLFNVETHWSLDGRRYRSPAGVRGETPAQHPLRVVE